jgi:hypothetical protein
MWSRIYCNNTFIRAIYVCDVLCVVTSVMAPRNDPDYDLSFFLRAVMSQLVSEQLWV